MTLTIYEMQSQAASWCTAAQEGFEEPTCSSKAEAIGYLALARLSSLLACVKSVYDVAALVWIRVIKVITIPLFDDFSLDSFVRAVIAFPLVVTLTALRIVCSIAGVISPELAYGVFRLHKVLLCLGLTCKIQYKSVTPGAAMLGALQPLLQQMNDQRWRRDAVNRAIQLVSEREESNRMVNKMVFVEEIWVHAITQAITDELGRIAREFARPVEVSHPILEVFQRKFTENVHAEALSAYRQKLYTKDDIEDMVTAFLPIMYRATCKAIVATFTVAASELRLGNRRITISEVRLPGGQTMILKDVVLEDRRPCTVQELPLVNTHPKRSIVSVTPIGEPLSHKARQLLEDEKVCVDNISLLDGTELTEPDSGGLAAWKDRLIEIILLIKDMSGSEKEALSYYLCADESRIHEVRPDLPSLASQPIIDRCFKLITEFYTAFIAHHMPPSGSALQGAFSISPDEE